MRKEFRIEIVGAESGEVFDWHKVSSHSREISLKERFLIAAERATYWSEVLREAGVEEPIFIREDVIYHHPAPEPQRIVGTADWELHIA